MQRKQSRTYRSCLLEALETRQLLSVTPHILELDGTSLTSNQTITWEAGIALNLRAVDTIDSSGNPSGGSTFSSGSTPNNTQFSWDFGDSAALTDADYTSGVRFAHNTLVGFNAAHVYDTPGTYPVTLTTTDQNGVVASLSINVAVSTTTQGSSHSDVSTADANILYVDSTSGNDTWTGTAPSRVGTSTDGPLKTFAAALNLLQTSPSWASNVQVRFKRGESFDVHQSDYAHGTTINTNGLIIGAYGSTSLARPILNCADTTLTAIISPSTTANTNWTIQDIAFSSSVAAGFIAYGDAMRFHGTDITVRDVTFGHHINDLFATGTVQGVLIADCSDQGNWVTNYDLECITTYHDIVVVDNSFTGASYQGDGTQQGHQPWVRFEATNGVESGRLLFTGNIDEPTAVNEDAFAFRQSVGSTTDVGYTDSPVSALTYSGGTTNITAGGAGIGGTSDKFSWLENPQSGDGTMIADVNSLTTGLSGAQAGVMMRDSTNANAMFADVMVTQTGISFQYRTTNGGTAATPVTLTTTDRWVKLVRTGNSFSAFHSATGSTWTQIGTAQTIAMNTNSQVGLAVTSGITGTNATASFSSATINGFAIGLSTDAFIYLSSNTFKTFIAKIGYKGGDVPGYLETWVVLDSNTFIDSDLVISNSANHIMIRNNLQENDTSVSPNNVAFLENSSYGSKVYSTGYGDNDPEILNNTQYTTVTGSGAGRLLGFIGSFWNAAVVVNNLVVAPGATSGSFGRDLYMIPSTSEFAQVDNNIYTDPSGTGSSLVVEVAGTNMTVATWNSSFRRAINATYSSSSFDDIAATIPLSGSFIPTSTAADIGIPVLGVWADHDGKARTATTWTVGAFDTVSLLAPTGLTATGQANQIALAWTGSTGASTYSIYRGTSSGGETLLHSGTATTSYTDTTAVVGTTYYYKVLAVNTYGSSPLSNEAHAAATSGSLFSGISETSPSTPAAIKANLQIGSTIYTDRTFTYTSVLSSGGTYNLAGADFIQTANSDKAVSGYSITYTLASNAYVYVLVDTANLSNLPSGVSGVYTNTGQTINGPTGTQYELFRAAESAGTYTIGAEVNGNNFYTLAAQPIANRFSNLTETSPSTPGSIQSNLQVGDNIYTDRTFTYVSVLSSGSTYNFAGADFIETANSDKAVSGYSLGYTLTVGSYVYILIDSANVSNLPTGMSSFTNTGKTLSETGVTYDIFRAFENAGTYTLGAQISGNNFYTVLAMST